MPSIEAAAVIIPAFNEGDRIAEVIDVAQSADPGLICVEKVIVVDNNSTDHTAEIAGSMGAEVLSCDEQGKGWAMLTGANYALELGASALTFLDADLKNLQPGSINRLAEPVLAERSLMTIGYLGKRKPLAKHILTHWGGFSGQRTVSLGVWDALQPSDFEGWRIEGALNAICRNSRSGQLIQRIELEGVSHAGKRDKEPNLFCAGRRYAETYGSAMLGLLSRSRIEG